MSPLHHAGRTAAFGAAHLAALAALGTDFGPLLAAGAIPALWLLAQHRLPGRRFDAIAMAVITAVWITVQGGSLGLALFFAAHAVVPATLFAWLATRWAPGWWLGHGERFRPERSRLARVTGAAAVAALAGSVVLGAGAPETFTAGNVIWTLVRESFWILLLVTLVRRVREHLARPQPRGLSLVR